MLGDPTYSDIACVVKNVNDQAWFFIIPLLLLLLLRAPVCSDIHPEGIDATLCSSLPVDTCTATS